MSQNIAMMNTGSLRRARGAHTWVDYLALEHDDRRELIDGEFVEGEVPNGPHEYTVGKLVAYLVHWTEERDAGFVLGSGYKVRISEWHGVMPDVQFFSKNNACLPAGYDGLAEGHPDLVIEVLSPTSRRLDRVTKLHYYGSIGTPEYWLVDPEERTLERFVLEGGGYRTDSKLTGDAILRPETLPGLAIPLANLWATRPALALFAALERDPERRGFEA